MRPRSVTLALIASLSAGAGSASCAAGSAAVVATDERGRTHVRGSLLAARDTLVLTVDRGHATLVAQRTFHNDGAEPAPVDLELRDVPAGAVAIGLRTGGSRDGWPVWYDATLLDAQDATRGFDDVDGIGGDVSQGRALLSWSVDALRLQLTPLDPGARKTVETTLHAPTRYEGGRYRLALPPSDGAFRPRVTLRAAHDGDRLVVGADELPSGAELPLPAAGLALALIPSSDERSGLFGAYAAVSLDGTHSLVHAALDVAPRLSELPREAWVVVALDASRSMTDTQRAAELSAARAYVGALPDAHVLVLTFDRAVTARTPGFVAAPDALAALAGGSLPAGNGSALDLALGEAATRLRVDAPAGAPRRLVAITDLHTRAALRPPAITALTVSSGAVVHLASIEDGAARLVRDDDDDWAAPARATGGVLWRAQAPRVDPDPLATRAVYEEWARPLRLDRLAVAGGAPGVDPPRSLKEGEGFSTLHVAAAAPAELTVEAELWSTKVAIRLASDDAGERLWSALAFGAPTVRDALDAAQMATLARRGHAVSPVTSLLAIEPGLRAAIDPRVEDTFSVGGFGCTGGCGGCGCGVRLRRRPRPSFDPLAWLRRALAPAAAKCGTAGRAATLRIETTTLEIVDVRVSWLVDEGDEARARCLEEAAWALELPPDFRAPTAAYEVALGGAP